MKGDDFIERKIIIGLIVSTDYIREVEKIWNPLFLESEMARMIAVWCLDYFRKYRNAPRKDIEGLYVAKMKEGLSEQQSEFIEAILQNLSHEYERGQFNEGYLLDQTRSYFQEQQLRQFAKDIEREVSAGQLIEAERLASSYRSLKSCEGEAINPFTVSAQYVRKVFEEKKEMLIRFPKELGEFWNTELVRGAFVALMAPEKHGKTFLLLELALRAMATGCHVAFFQGGDMSEKQQFYRICTYLTKKPGKKKHTNGLWVPKVDCLYNQLDTCRRAERECDFGVFHDASEINFENLVRASTDNPEYKPCRNCKNIKGSPWLIWKPPIPILPWKDAFLALRKWGERYKREFKLDTYANDTLMISDIRARLDTWERQEGFVPDVIIVDYADILAPDPDFRKLDFRNQQNKLWQRLRTLSQERHCLVLTATQAAASSYDRERLGKKDFSEDKRKYAHVTAMYGMNQTDDEKHIGVLRLNQLVIREDDFSTSNEVHILQRLQIGRPMLGSYK